MPINDISKKPFDQGTLTKLDIFEAYVRSWLPVFIQASWCYEINICDFFAGTGQDSLGNPGSSIRIINTIEIYRDSIIEKNLKINLVLNEFKKKKFNQLKTVVETKLNDSGLIGLVHVEFHQKDFQTLFQSKISQIRDMPNLLFLDQNGIKQITENIFESLETFPRTDFMFFIASSYFKRFKETKEFQNFFPDIDKTKIEDITHGDSHRFIIDYYRGKLPTNSTTSLYPFTIKKGRNIYGLIFGSKNIRGVEKFLEVAWDKNKINGEANFDIDADIQKQQGVLFEEMITKTKFQRFEDDIRLLFSKSSELSNKNLYNFALENGFLPGHAANVVKVLKKESVIDYKGHPKINYNKCYKTPDIVKFEVKTK